MKCAPVFSVVGELVRFIVVKRDGRPFRVVQGADESVGLRVADSLGLAEVLNQLGLGEHLLDDWLLGGECGGLFCLLHGFRVALLVEEHVVLVDQQGELRLHFEFHPLPAFNVLLDAVVLLVQLDLRTVLGDHLVRLGDGPIDASQELIADGRLESGGHFDFFPRLLQDRQRL